MQAESGTHVIPAFGPAEPSPPPMRALETKALRATVWSIIEYGSGTGLRMVSSLVLTRLLLPAYLGEMTLISTLIFGINLLSDIGLAPNVIQSPRGDDPHFLNTAYSLQAIRGVALWIVSLILAWPMALFYHDPHIKDLLPVLGLCTLLSGFYSTNLLSMSRHMDVRRLFAIDFSTAVVSLITTIVWAHFHASVWAIIGGQIAGTIYRYTLSHMQSVAPGPRNHFAWDKDALHSIIHFGKWIFTATAFYFFASQADRLVLGKLIPFALLGIYGIAYQLSDIPRQIIIALSNRVFYPFIAKIIDQPIEDFRKSFLRYRMMVLAAGAVLLSLMFTWGYLVITEFYPRAYAAGAWIIPLLSLGLWDTLLHQTTNPVLLSLGKSKYGAVGNALWCATIYFTITFAFHHFGANGFHAAVIAIAFGDLPVYVVTQFGATKEKIRPLKQDLLLTGFFACMIGICSLLGHTFKLLGLHLHHG